ncbi:MAG: glucose-phosphate thymidylyltransferase [Candidatus Methanomethylophilaceae archaeon]|nr:glucose-phosphate thymidylyltransferase [Candidatus Methanomethylophilaceae archaeon]
MHPASLPISKILLPVYDKPMIYYPLSNLIMGGIRDILVITNEEDDPKFRKLLGDGSQFGVNIDYLIQYVQKGISHAFIIAEDWIDGDDTVLILGDNIFYGPGLQDIIVSAIKENDGATVFGYYVNDPERFGVVEFDEDMKAISIEEKPKEPKSNYAVVGLYFYDGNACKYAKKLKPSKRGELEITDLNKVYMEEGRLKVKLFDEDINWLDAGTFDSLLEAGNSIKAVQDEHKINVGCPEEAALKNGFVTKEEVLEWMKRFKDNSYLKYVQGVCK